VFRDKGKAEHSKSKAKGKLKVAANGDGLLTEKKKVGATDTAGTLSGGKRGAARVGGEGANVGGGGRKPKRGWGKRGAGGSRWEWGMGIRKGGKGRESGGVEKKASDCDGLEKGDQREKTRKKNGARVKRGATVDLKRKGMGLVLSVSRR